MTVAVPVDVWWADVEAPVPPLDVLTRVLDDVERARLTALRAAADRQRFAVAAALARIVLGDWLGVAPERVPLRRDCPDCVRRHGRPVVTAGVGPRPPVHSVSHSGRWVAVAATATGRLGVDLETVTAARPLAAELVLQQAELDRGDDPWAAWVRKEAALKATGEGLRRRPTELAWTPSPTEARAGRVVLGHDRGAVLCTYDLAAPAGTVAALAADRPPLVRVHDGTTLLRRVFSTRDLPSWELPCPA